MSNENSNAQTDVQTPPVSPDATGPNVADLQAQLVAEKAARAELERQSEGRLRDLQQERQKRQELEARLVPPAPAPAPAAEADPVADLLKPHLAPIVARAEKAEKIADEYMLDKAWGYLEAKTGKRRSDLEKDMEFQKKIVDAQNKWGVKGNIYEMTQKSYELMQLEELKTKEEERSRNTVIANTQPLSGGNPPVPTNNRSYTAAAFSAMPPAEYDKLSRTGSFRKVNGEFVYTPRS
jgi:hypothetical protein